MYEGIGCSCITLNADFKMNVHGTRDEHNTEILSEWDDGRGGIHQSQWVFYLNHPEVFLETHTVDFRKRLPLCEFKEVTADGSEIIGLIFEHEWMSGIYVTSAVLLTLLGLFLGLLWSFKWRDPATGFTIATIIGLPLTSLTVFVTIHKQHGRT